MRFVPRPEAEYEVKATSEASAALLSVAEAGAAQAALTAPEKTGNYRRAMRATVTMTPIGYQGVVYNTDYKANWIERGTLERFTSQGVSRGRMPAYHVLYNAVRAIGLATFEVS